jgi:peptidoglycan hydrolase-like protein with peptidoglycan-binding domain
MQNALKGLNYPAAADGIFGPDTLSALKAFQMRKSLMADGAAGPNTLGRLYSGNALGYAGEAGTDTMAAVDTQRGRVLHLRSSRSDAGSKNILASIPSGTRLTVLSKGEGWTKVTYSGKTGYVRTGFLRFPSTPEKVKTGIGSGEALVSTQPGRSLNLRSSQSSAHSANIIAYIPSGTVVGLIEAGPSWSRISFGGLTGYAQSGYLQLP